MRKLTGVVSCLILALIATGCKAAPQPGIPVTHATACDTANNDKRVSLEGYPRFSPVGTTSLDFGINLWEHPNSGGKSVLIYIPAGTAANQIDNLRSDTADAALKIHTNTNQVVGTDTRIRVTGSLSVIKSDGTTWCVIEDINLIEAAPTS